MRISQSQGTMNLNVQKQITQHQIFINVLTIVHITLVMALIQKKMSELIANVSNNLRIIKKIHIDTHKNS